MPIVVGVAIAVVVVAVIVVIVVRRREPDAYDSFQRQIDALSPEARRSVVEQLNQVADDAGDPAGDHGAGAAGDDGSGDSGSGGREAERPDGA